MMNTRGMKALYRKGKFCPCGKKSIPGLKSNIALCQYHYDAMQWGTLWANWIHGKAKCSNCDIPLGKSEGIYRSFPLCVSCDEKTIKEKIDE